MVELRALGQKLKPFWKQFDTRNPPSSVLLANGFKVSCVEQRRDGAFNGKGVGLVVGGKGWRERREGMARRE